MRRLVVDAMNVIGSRPDGWWRDREGAIRRFVTRLEAYAEHHDGPVTVVIDGRPVDEVPEGRRGALDVRYAARRGRNAADDRIVALLDEWDEPATVVTADRDLRDRVAALGASTTGPRDLLDALDRLTEQA